MNASGTLRRRNIAMTANIVLNGIANVLPSAQSMLLTRSTMLKTMAGRVVAVNTVLVFQFLPSINLYSLAPT